MSIFSCFDCWGICKSRQYTAYEQKIREDKVWEKLSAAQNEIQFLEDAIQGYNDNYHQSFDKNHLLYITHPKRDLQNCDRHSSNIKKILNNIKTLNGRQHVAKKEIKHELNQLKDKYPSSWERQTRKIQNIKNALSSCFCSWGQAGGEYHYTAPISHHRPHLQLATYQTPLAIRSCMVYK